jgi:uncharacterized protein YcgL (UPF0745 family)
VLLISSLGYKKTIKKFSSVEPSSRLKYFTEPTLVFDLAVERKKKNRRQAFLPVNR